MTFGVLKLMLIIACVVNFDEGRSHRKPSEVRQGRLKHHLKHHLHAMIVEVGAVVDEHQASLATQGVQHGFYPRWSPGQVSIPSNMAQL